MKTQVSKEQAYSELKELFAPVNEESCTRFGDYSFLIDKIDYERFDVIGMLRNYFQDKVIEGCAVEVSPTTLRFTVFKIIDL